MLRGAEGIERAAAAAAAATARAGLKQLLQKLQQQQMREQRASWLHVNLRCKCNFARTLKAGLAKRKAAR